MKKILCMKTEVEEIIAKERESQCKRNLFLNIAVKPYNGKSYDKNLVCWVVVG